MVVVVIYALLYLSIFEGIQFQELYQNKYVAICEQKYQKN
jgi:hypothetical protein